MRVRTASTSRRAITGEPLRRFLKLGCSIGQFEEVASRMRLAQGALPRRGLTILPEQSLVASIGICLKDTALALQMGKRMLHTPVARVVVVDRCRRLAAAERPIVAYVSSQPSGVSLAICQHRDGRVIAVHPLTGEGVRLDQAIEQHERRGASTALIGQGRKAELDTLAGIALPPTVKGRVRIKFLKQNHSQEAGPKQPTRRYMEGRGWLRDPLALPAGEFLPHGLSDFPPPRDHLKRLG